MMVVGAASLLVACGGGDDDPDEALGESDAAPDAGSADDDDRGEDGEVDACALLSAEEIEAAVGNPVEDGQESFGGCEWTSGPDETKVSIFIIQAPPEICREALGADPVQTEVDGFGDPAFLTENPEGFPQASVVVCHEIGQVQLIVTAGVDDPGTDQPAITATTQDLARLALDRL